MNSNWSYSPETLNSGQNWRFLVPWYLEIWQRTLKTLEHLFYAASSFVHHFKAIGEFKLKLQSRNIQFGLKSAIFVPCDLEIWRMALETNRAPFLCCFKFRASFYSHLRIQIATVWKWPIWVKFEDFFVSCDLKIWQMTLKINRAPLLSYFKLCASFRYHWWIRTGVQIDDFLAMWPKHLTDDHEKQQGTST